MLPYKISIIIALLFAIIEITTGTFIFMGFSIGVLIVAIIEFIAGNFSMGREIVVFSISSLIAVIVLRKIFRGKNDQSSLRDDDINMY
jgi:membrane protein implicated in regulation of membrane protease activity